MDTAGTHKALQRLARGGLFRAGDLAASRIPRTALPQLVAAGVVERLSRGLYRLTDAEESEHSSIAEVAKRVPHATICLLSALQLHEMTTEAPHAVWVMIDRHARRPVEDGPKLEVVRASGAARTHGVKQHAIDGLRVRVTSPAKTVADCFRFRRHVGLEVALDALRAYLRQKKGSVDDLLEAARADRISAFMRPYLEALA